MIHNDIAADCELYPPEICPQEKETLNRLVNNLAVDPAISEYHVVFLQLLAPFYNRLYLLLTRDLTNHGIPSSFLFKSGMAHSATPLEQDGIPLSNSIILQKNKCVLNTGKPHVLSKKWIVEPENRRIEAEGVNFYPVIAATLQALLKTYDIPYSDPKISQWVGEMVTTADLCVEYFFLLKRYAQENGKKIKLVAWECGYLPNGLFFLLCREHAQNRDIEFIDLRIGYPRYLQKHFHATELLACNRTVVDMPTRYTRDRKAFEKYMAQTDKGGPKRLVERLLSPGKNKPLSAVGEKYLNRISRHKKENKRIFVLLSHLFYDTSINEDKRCFTGMTQWIKKTVEYFKGRKDILVLKPHPMEGQRNPNQTLESFVTPLGLEDNMILLPPEALPLTKLVPYSSCGLIWRTTGALELILQNVPCNICGFAEYHFLDLPFSTTEETYFDAIDDITPLRVTQSMKEEAMYCLSDLSESHISLDCFDYDAVDSLHTFNREKTEHLLQHDSLAMARLRKAILD